MKKLICALLIVMTILSLTACSIVLPITATSNNLGSKVGEASYSIGGEGGSTGDASIATAAKNGGIKKISTVDYKISFLEGGTFFSFTTVVTGE